jgi:BirA family biotin operon repressor/biotin-[acetyl-CoA-carboxylase] ligase
LAEPRFDRARFASRLATRRLGRSLLVRAETGSTNDDAWDARAAGGPDGLVVVADDQVRGRGRAGRTWAHAPGLGLALSVAMDLGCDARQAGVAPLVAGLALAEALAERGVAVSLKWPNDVLCATRKLAGLLCELRRPPGGGDVVVIGAGVNVRQRADDFPPDLRERATSVTLAGSDATVEDVAAGFLNALEPLWARFQEGDRAALLAAWTARATGWGNTVTVRGPGGDVTGTAVRVDEDGALVLRLESGAERRVVAGDVEPAAAGEAR